MQIHKCYTKEAFLALSKSEPFVQRAKLERYIATCHKDEETFYLAGYCRVHDHPTSFLVDRNFGAVQLDDGVWIPNWRERLVCPDCNLNNRQRAMASVVLDQAQKKFFAKAAARKPVLYLTEQLTYTFHNLSNRFPQLNLIGSEFLGPRFKSGEVRDGTRHEDLESLSFGQNSIDFVLSSDALQFVPDPSKALSEFCRVLQPGGQLFLGVPFNPSNQNSRQRARLVHGDIENLQPPIFMSTPVSEQGALVFTDFGWDILSMLREAGFSECSLNAYWSYEMGNLGGAQFYFHGLK